MGMPSLSLRHGFRCVTEATVTVEEFLVAVGEKVGYENIAYASRMNKAVVVFLKEECLVDVMVEHGVLLKGECLVDRMVEHGVLLKEECLVDRMVEHGGLIKE